MTIRRSTESRAATDKSTIQTWATVATGAKVLLQPATARLLQHSFGRELEATFVGFAETTTDLATGDGLLVTAGYRAGDRLEVVDLTDPDQGPRHRVLALTSDPRADAFT